MVKLSNETKSKLVLKFKTKKGQEYSRILGSGSYLNVEDGEYEVMQPEPKVTVTKYNFVNITPSKPVNLYNSNSFRVTLKFKYSASQQNSKVIEPGTVTSLKEGELDALVEIPKGVTVAESTEELLDLEKIVDINKVVEEVLSENEEEIKKVLMQNNVKSQEAVEPIIEAVKEVLEQPLPVGEVYVEEDKPTAGVTNLLNVEEKKELTEDELLEQMIKEEEEAKNLKK